VNWVRHQISERKSLEQICEDCMTRCLSPDSDVAGGVGCDNMTILVVALLHGRTLDQWYDWVTERVEKKIGYSTPRTYSPIYPAGRFGPAAAAAAAAAGDLNGPPPFFRSGGTLGRLNHSPLYGNTGLSAFTGGRPGAGNDDDVDDDDEFDDDSGDELMTDSSSDPLRSILGGSGNGIIGGPVRLRAPPQRDETSSLRAQLYDLDEDKSEPDGQYDDAMEDVQSSDDQTPVINISSNNITNRRPISIGSPRIATPPSLKDIRSPILSNNELPRQTQRSRKSESPKPTE